MVQFGLLLDEIVLCLFESRVIIGVYNLFKFWFRNTWNLNSLLTTMGRHSSPNHSPSTRRQRSRHSVSPPPRVKHRHSSGGSARLGSVSPDPPHRSRSPSPRTKRLKRVQSQREPEREHEGERKHGGSGGRGYEREAIERKEKKRVENDDNGGTNGRSSRSRHERSPERHHNGRSRHRSQSPQHHASAENSKPRDEVSGDIRPLFKLLFQFLFFILFFHLFMFGICMLFCWIENFSRIYVHLLLLELKEWGRGLRNCVVFFFVIRVSYYCCWVLVVTVTRKGVIGWVLLKFFLMLIESMCWSPTFDSYMAWILVISGVLEVI